MPPEPAVANEVNDVGTKLIQVLAQPARREPNQRDRVQGNGPSGEAGQAVNLYAIRQRLAVGPVGLGYAREGVLGREHTHGLNLL